MQLEAIEVIVLADIFKTVSVLKCLDCLLPAQDFIALLPIFGEALLDLSVAWTYRRGYFTTSSGWAAWQFDQMLRKTLWSKEWGKLLRAAHFDTPDMLLLLGSAYKILKLCGYNPPMGQTRPFMSRRSMANPAVVHALVLCAMDLSPISEEVIDTGRRALILRCTNQAEKREVFSYQVEWANRMGSHCWYGEDEHLLNGPSGLRMD